MNIGAIRRATLLAVCLLNFGCQRHVAEYHLLYGYIGLALGFGVTALLIIILTRGRLGYQHYRAERQGVSPED